MTIRIIADRVFAGKDFHRAPCVIEIDGPVISSVSMGADCSSQKPYHQKDYDHDQAY